MITSTIGWNELAILVKLIPVILAVMGESLMTEEPTRVESRLSSIITGLIVLAVGVFGMIKFSTPDDQGFASNIFGYWVLFSPAISIVGLVFTIRSAYLGIRAFSGRSVLIAGLLMVLLGAYPWFYTPLLIRDGGMEGSGMLGTFLFVFLGIPGVVFTIIGLCLKGWGSDKS